MVNLLLLSGADVKMRNKVHIADGAAVQISFYLLESLSCVCMCVCVYVCVRERVRERLHVSPKDIFPSCLSGTIIAGQYDCY